MPPDLLTDMLLLSFEEIFMAYIDGFVIPCPKARRQEFIDHARSIDVIFLEFGATRVVECWADDVPDGTVTDFRKAVQAQDDEDAVFSWIEWPDKATRDAGMAKLNDPEFDDPRMRADMPFDGKRMIFGGFAPVVTMEK
jgi:uncharacterized protein YbaA (DUF1428 family)